MEKYQINLNTPIKGDDGKLIIDRIESDSDSFVFILNAASKHSLKEGQNIFYERSIYKGDGQYDIISDKGIITKIENNKLTITSPKSRIFNVKTVYKINDSNTLHIVLNERHNVFQQDLELYGDKKINFYDYKGKPISSFTATEVSIPKKYGDRTITSADCLTQIDSFETCNNTCGKIDLYEYRFISENTSLNELLLNVSTSADVETLKECKYVTFDYNPYFYKSGEEIKPFEDNWLKSLSGQTGNNSCIRYKLVENNFNLKVYDLYYKLDVGLESDDDMISLLSEDSFKEKYVDSILDNIIPDVVDMERIKYEPAYIPNGVDYEPYYVWNSPEDYGGCSDNKTIYTKITNFEKRIYSGTELSNFYYFDENNVMVNSNEDVAYYNYDTEHIVDEIPTIYKTFTNGEGCKYYLSDEKIDFSSTIITGITFCLHFRRRKEITNEDRDMNTKFTSGNVYYDTWHIDKEEDNTTWWNDYKVDGVYYTGETFDVESFTEFNELYGEKSDLIGYLNFTDNDIFYRKKKVSQSFLRLTFYDSADPIEQKLLYYSTIFLDGGELYGKYIKQLQFIHENKYDKIPMGQTNPNAFVALFPYGNKLDSQINVTNEYDRMKSSEGFNLYLFAADKTFNFENGEKTIYMKIEFNHAGNGKTIPLIQWPTNDDGVFVPLTTDNFFDSLYIPVKLSYINGRYTYSIIGGKYNNNNLTLVLYEPKLDMPEEVEIDGDN